MYLIDAVPNILMAPIPGLNNYFKESLPPVECSSLPLTIWYLPIVYHENSSPVLLVTDTPTQGLVQSSEGLVRDEWMKSNSGLYTNLIKKKSFHTCERSSFMMIIQLMINMVKTFYRCPWISWFIRAACLIYITLLRIRIIMIRSSVAL